MKKIVIFGGGSGLSQLLKGIKLFPVDITAVVSVADNGGSTGLLRRELNKLNKRDKEIMILRYGLNGNAELTQKEVAEKLGISQSYISRIEKKVIKKLGNIIKI